MLELIAKGSKIAIVNIVPKIIIIIDKMSDKIKNSAEKWKFKRK